MSPRAPLKGMSPYEALYGKKPDLSKLRRFGENVWVHNPNGSKLESRARKGRWLGFDEISSGHRIYWEDKRNVTVERSISFETRDAVLEGELDGYVKPAPPDFKFDEQPDVTDNEESDSPAADAPVDESKTEEHKRMPLPKQRHQQHHPSLRLRQQNRQCDAARALENPLT